MSATAWNRLLPRARKNVQARRRVPPPLENRDTLTATEFLRRFEASPHVKKAELINGIVHMPSPVRLVQHGTPDNFIQTWLGLYAAHTPGTRAGANSTVCFDPDNVPQPDALLMIEPACGGSARIGEDGFLHGPPEFIAEIAGSSSAYDLREKLHAYRRAGVQEYFVWRTVDRACDWFVREGDDFVLLPPGRDGVIHSRIFPGLCLDTKALLEENAGGVLSRLTKNLNKAAHKAFVAKLRGKR